MDCTSSGCLANAMQAVMATLSWLMGRHEFCLHDVTHDSTTSSSSSSSSYGSPTAPRAGSSKVDVPFSTDGKTPSSATINVSADSTGRSQALNQGPAKSGKKKKGKLNKRKGSMSVDNQTKVAGDEAAKTAEKEREEEEEKDINTFKVAGKSRGSRGKKRTAAGSSAPLSIKRTIQHGPELITGMGHPCFT